MRVVIQRVTSASVTVDEHVVGQIDTGLLLLVGIAPEDTTATTQLLADKTANMRLFADENGRMNRSVIDAGGACLVVSQFTLYANVRRGRRPGFTTAARPDIASPLVDAYSAALRAYGLVVAIGVFGANMQVALVNDGPVTILLDSKDLQPNA
ncbi:MAG: D-tyrosyl-tRNA(Tyr) deacylase [Chloroflexaceae bacterium]|nr:D-tyrosyl-tRNA(Tyr) deacylase [Chloroflexaceae bacterium]